MVIEKKVSINESCISTPREETSRACKDLFEIKECEELSDVPSRDFVCSSHIGHSESQSEAYME